jgi:hypothetical protein
MQELIASKEGATLKVANLPKQYSVHAALPCLGKPADLLSIARNNGLGNSQSTAVCPFWCENKSSAHRSNI